MALGVKQLHEQWILHWDIKSANVFLMKDGTVKLGDLNVSKILKEEGFNYTQAGTPGYASPEIWKDKPYGLASDIWSLGCVLYELICLWPPFRAKNIEGLYLKIVKGIYSPISSQSSVELSSMVRAMLQTKAERRPTIDEILEKPYIKWKLGEIFNPTVLTDTP